MIVPEGWPFVLVPLCAGATTAVLGWPAAGWTLIAGGLLLLVLLRDPARECAGPATVVCSPVDGRVLWIGAARPGSGDAMLPVRIRVQSSWFDVRVERAPIDGTVDSVERRVSRGLAGVSSRRTAWAGVAGRLAVTRTPAGGIVLEAGTRTTRGQRLDVLRPAVRARLDIELPLEAEVLVTTGDRVRAGQTPLARLEPLETR